MNPKIKLIKASAKLKRYTPNAAQAVECAGRVCYKSESKITKDSSYAFCTNLLNSKHLSVIEHATATVHIVCDRGVSHELVRHRLIAVSQESTRYCNYHKKGMRFILPFWVNRAEIKKLCSGSWYWYASISYSAEAYNDLIEYGWVPEKARTVLPNSLATELMVTANLREWRHIFEMRCAKDAHPQMREIMLPLLCQFKGTPALSVFFKDFELSYDGNLK